MKRRDREVATLLLAEATSANEPSTVLSSFTVMLSSTACYRVKLNQIQFLNLNLKIYMNTFVWRHALPVTRGKLECLHNVL